MFFRIKNIEDKKWCSVAKMDIYLVNIQCYSHKKICLVRYHNGPNNELTSALIGW